MHGNVRRYVQVAAVSRWHVFLQAVSDTGLNYSIKNCRVGKNRDTKRGSPAVPGRTVPLTTKRCSLARKFSRYRAAIAYTGLLEIVAASIIFIRNSKDLTRVRLSRNGNLLAMPLQPRKRRDTAELGCIALPC